MARLLELFGVPVRVIHDTDRKERTDEELQADKGNEFHANQRIAEIVGADSVLAVDDTFEHLLWAKDSAPKSSSDKPFRAWKRARELASGRDNLDHAVELRKAMTFAFGF